jgi:hypothetical protein
MSPIKTHDRYRVEMIRQRDCPKSLWISIASIVLCLCAAAGCSSSTGPQEPGTPAVSFEFSGVRSGGFAVSTDADIPGYVPRSFLYSRTTQGSFFVWAFSLSDATSGDLVSVVAPTPVGTYAITCGVLVVCPTVGGKLGMDFATQQLNQGGVYFELTSGTITVTRSGADRIEGTFSGTGPAHRMTDGQLVLIGQLTIKQGRFSAIPKAGQVVQFDRWATPARGARGRPSGAGRDVARAAGFQ